MNHGSETAERIRTQFFGKRLQYQEQELKTKK